MSKYNGIGLAAPQVGLSLAFFITRDYVAINPKIISARGWNSTSQEGCLSFPGLSLNVERPEWIMAQFINENGQLKQMRMEGLTARCFQHELDHMNGIKFTSHSKPVALQLARDRQKKLIKKIKRMSK